MTPGARVAAAIEVMDRILVGEAAEKALTSWGRANRYAGSKDRAAVRDLVYQALRQKRSAASIGGESGRGILIGVTKGQWAALFTGEGYAPPPLAPGEGQGQPSKADLHDLPEWLWSRFVADHGEEEAARIAEVLRHRAPITLRTVTRNIGRDALAERLRAEGAEARAVAPTGALILEGDLRSLRRSGVVEAGLAELQDASAQAFCTAIPAAAGERVLDLCAGGGGKILALADRVEIAAFAHDAHPRRMADLPRRAQRAGVEVQCLDTPEDRAPFDGVICDVPCSGSGTWRRDPEGKWRLTEEDLASLVALQREILFRAVSLLRPGGWLAYATCSILSVENAAQINWLQEEHIALRLEVNRLVRPDGERDGFFWAILRHEG